ncbi:hypothetical protein B566_EDAN008080, partial [Ephemera danica]
MLIRLVGHLTVMAKQVASLTLFVVLCTLMQMRVHGQTVEVDVRCTASYCGEWLTKNKCPPLDEQCLKEGTMFTYPAECSCCDYCLKYLKEDEWCDIGQPGQPTPGAICGSGLTCTIVSGLDQGVCKRMVSECHRAQDKYDEEEKNGTLGHLRQRPACDQYGNYSPASCIPGSICYCTDPNGGRIFGEVAYDSPDLLRTLTCMFAHCLQNGSYDPLQCVDNKCTCVDQEGMSNQARIHVADLNMTSPSCFSPDLDHKVGRYVRECELRRSDLLARQRTAAKANATAVLSDLPNCGLDGRYERLQVKGDFLVCTDPYGKQIADFKQGRYTNPSSVDCNCARTRYMLREAAKKSGLSPYLPQCCPNGNFKRWQCNRGFCYCVDSNGNQ